MSERIGNGGGVNSSVWRQRATRATLYAIAEDVSSISRNPGHWETKEHVMLISGSFPPVDMRVYEYDREGNFRIPEIVGEEPDDPNGHQE